MDINYFSPGMVDEVIDECNKLLSHEENADLRVILGNAYLNKGVPSSAIVEYQKALKAKPKDVILMLRLGEAYKNMELFNDAIDILTRVLEVESDWADANKHLGDVYFSMGLMDKALEQYQRALDINPLYTEANLMMAQVLEEMGMLKEAIQIYRNIVDEKLLKMHGDVNMARAHADLAVFYGQKELSAEAIEHLRKVITFHPDWPDAFYNLGVALKTQGEYEDAMIQFKRALELNPRYEKARNAYWECGQIVEGA